MSVDSNFTTWKLLRFAFPSVIMMIFMSLYIIIDGIFISRFAGSNALSSLNIVYPVINLVMAIASMLASGGNAIISQYLGQGKKKEARECLSQFVVIGVVVSLVIVVVTLTFLEPICYVLGSTEILLADCKTYLRIVTYFAPALMLQILFQTYLVTAGRPEMGMIFIIAAGLVNAVLDYVFMAVFHMGIEGAALATGLGESILAIAGVFYFFLSKGELHFSSFTLQLKEIGMACYNGSSEMIGQLSNAVITFLFNMIMLKLVGEHGVAGITILLYGQYLFNAFYMGVSIGISPILGFQYGAKNKIQLREIYKSSMIFVVISSCVITGVSILSLGSIVSIFTDDKATFELAVSGFEIFALNFLFSGINIATSGIFTALSNGKISAIISFTRTLGFTVLFLLILPEMMGVVGVWLAIPIAEFVTLILCVFMHWKYFFKAGKENYFA